MIALAKEAKFIFSKNAESSATTPPLQGTLLPDQQLRKFSYSGIPDPCLHKAPGISPSGTAA